jgi:hypothetical protein
MNYYPRQYNSKGVYHPNVVARNEVDWEHRAVNSMRTRLQKKERFNIFLIAKRKFSAYFSNPSHRRRIDHLKLPYDLIAVLAATRDIQISEE